MVHPDYQYTPKLIPAMASIIANGLHPCVLASRILGGYSLRAGCRVEICANRFLTAAENHPARREAFGIPHGLPRVLAGNSGDA
jgi:hypothetical protein